MPVAGRRIIALAAAAMLFAGSYQLDANHQRALGYGLLLLGSVLLLISNRPLAATAIRAARWFSIGLVVTLAASAIAASAYVTAGVLRPDLLTPLRQLLLWLASGLACVLACHAWDTHPGAQAYPRLFGRADWLWMFGLFVTATALRLYHLGVDPPGITGDEIWVLARTIHVRDLLNLPPFQIDDLAVTGLYKYLVSLFLTYLDWTGLDFVQTAKLPNVLFGGASVALLYATARRLSNRRIAATAGVFLLWQGWHWILSRLYYLYSGDALWVALATALLIAGVQSRRSSLIAAAGCIAALSVAWMKSSLLVTPWAGIVLLEAVLTQPAARRRHLLDLVLFGTVFAVCVAPIVAEFAQHTNFWWRFQDVVQERARLLGAAGLTSAQGYYRGFLGAFTALQFGESEAFGRHVVRLGRPALDVIASALATLGFLRCLWEFRRSSGARLCVLGFLLFLWPAISSYPADGEPAASRRMIGSALFVAWMAAIGADLVVRRTLPKRFQFGAMLALAATSALLNARSIQTSYNTRLFNWHEEFGSGRVLIIRALRQAAGVGPVFYRPTNFTEQVRWALVDLPNVTAVQDVAELRRRLEEHAGQLCVVLLSGRTSVDRNDSPRWIDQLADLIPPNAWEFGPPDPVGVPIYRIAHIEVPRPSAP